MIEPRRLPLDTVGYERIPNSAILDPDLSLAELGLLVRALAFGHRFASFAEMAAALMPAVEPGQKPPNGYGRDAYLKAAAGLERAGYSRKVKGPSSGYGKPGANVTEVSAVPFGADDANAQVNSETGMSGVRIDQARYAEGCSTGPAADHALTGSTCGNAENAQVNSDTGHSGFRIAPSVTCGDAVNPQVNSDTGHSGFRIAPSVTCGDAVNPQVNSDTGHSVAALSYTDIPPDPPNPRSDQAKEEGEGTASPEPPAEPDAALAEQAHAILDALPADRRTNSGDRKTLLPAIVERLKLGWPADILEDYLAAGTLPEKVISLRGLLANWLPPERRYVAPKRAAPSPSGLPDWCTSCGGHYAEQARSNARFRTLDGELGSPKCPRCHPDQTGTRTP